jgi:transcriptional regulator of acetoin/glycerol metabolism
MSRVARALGIGRSTLYRKLREYGLDEAMERDAA